MESPGKQGRRSRPATRLAGRPVGALGFGGSVFALIESAPAPGAVGVIALIALLY
jgi:hypothetical protein